MSLAKWYVLDRYGRRWFPYVEKNLDGVSEVLVHLEGADTDMGDLWMYELEQMLGPITVRSSND